MGADQFQQQRLSCLLAKEIPGDGDRRGGCLLNGWHKQTSSSRIVHRMRVTETVCLSVRHMCSVELVPFPIPGLGGYYMAYSTTIVSAEKGMFRNWEDILTRSLGSLDYSGSYTSSAMAQSDAAMRQSQQLRQSANEMQDAIMSSWESRNTSQDIISQKQSDATMGFERVMDTETGEIYQTDNGFTDWYDEERYKAITDDQYTEAVVGRFSWK